MIGRDGAGDQMDAMTRAAHRLLDLIERWARECREAGLTTDQTIEIIRTRAAQYGARYRDAEEA